MHVSGFTTLQYMSPRPPQIPSPLKTPSSTFGFAKLTSFRVCWINQSGSFPNGMAHPTHGIQPLFTGGRRSFPPRLLLTSHDRVEISVRPPTTATTDARATANSIPRDGEIFEFGRGFYGDTYYFRVISIHFNPYCTCALHDYDRFAAHSHGNYCSYLQAF